jgi:hypothetical protein
MEGIVAGLAGQPSPVPSAGTPEVRHTLTPLIVVMAGANDFDRYMD